MVSAAFHPECFRETLMKLFFATCFALLLLPLSALPAAGPEKGSIVFFSMDIFRVAGLGAREVAVIKHLTSIDCPCKEYALRMRMQPVPSVRPHGLLF